MTAGRTIDATSGATISGNVRSSGQVAILTGRDNKSFADEDKQRQWLKDTLNLYVNVLRPRIKRLAEAR